MTATETNYEDLWTAWRDAGLEGWSRATQQMVESDVFPAAMKTSLDWTLALHKRMRENVDQSLAALDLPTRGDLARLSIQIAAAEMRALDCEERLDEMAARMNAAEARAVAFAQQLDDMRAALPSAPAKATREVAPRRAKAKSDSILIMPCFKNFKMSFLRMQE